MATKKTPLDLVAALGLALGAVFGMAGTFVTQPNRQAMLWAIDSVGLVMATALLSLKFFRRGNDLVAGGFLVFAIGEGVMLSGTAMGPAGSVPAFAAGTALWAAALALISVPTGFAIGIRLVGIVAALLFAITSGRIFHGEQITPTSSPLPFFAFPVLVLNFVGWIWTLLKERAD
jgi:hypothetical protein